MKSIWVIAKNTFHEIIRDRILYGLVVFALLLIGFSLALGELSFAEQTRISLDFGLSGIQLSAVILAVFVGSSLVTREIEKRTILTLLARPLTRTQFLIGKFLGLTLVITTVTLGLAMVMTLVMWGMGVGVHLGFFIALWGIWLEALILLALALVFGSFAKPMMTVVLSIGIFLIGHWMDSLAVLTNKSSGSDILKLVSQMINWTLPNLEKFNWRSLPVYDMTITSGEFLNATLYAAMWVLLLISLTSIVFRRKDFA